MKKFLYFNMKIIIIFLELTEFDIILYLLRRRSCGSFQKPRTNSSPFSLGRCSPGSQLKFRSSNIHGTRWRTVDHSDWRIIYFGPATRPSIRSTQTRSHHWSLKWQSIIYRTRLTLYLSIYSQYKATFRTLHSLPSSEDESSICEAKQISTCGENMRHIIYIHTLYIYYMSISYLPPSVGGNNSILMLMKNLTS